MAAGPLDARFAVGCDLPVRGIATSGRSGRSFSLGIADAVTVLAADAAGADVAATLIANAVDLDHPAIKRCPARDLDPDSDLGEHQITLDVGPLDEAAVNLALGRGAAEAEGMQLAGLIFGAVLMLGGRHKVIGEALFAALAHAA